MSPTAEIRVDEEMRAALESFGLKTFSDWMSLEGIPYREISMRSGRPVVALEVPGLKSRLFLKRHLETARAETIFQKLGIAPIPSEARKEASKYVGFARSGIPTPEVVAWGEGEWEGNPRASFIATRDLEALPLERYLFRNWQRPVTGDRLTDKRTTIEQLGLLTRKMHQAGWVHRDLYLGHVFVREFEENGSDRLVVIDVQRASRRPRWWIRSRIKDLASLHFSADPKYISGPDRLRFLKAYWGAERFSPFQRWLIRWILRKSARIRKHTEKSLGIPYRDFFKNKYY